MSFISVHPNVVPSKQPIRKRLTATCMDRNKHMLYRLYKAINMKGIKLGIQRMIPALAMRDFIPEL